MGLRLADAWRTPTARQEARQRSCGDAMLEDGDLQSGFAQGRSLVSLSSCCNPRHPSPGEDNGDGAEGPLCTGDFFDNLLTKLIVHRTRRKRPSTT